jgi:hypothetical protein
MFGGMAPAPGGGRSPSTQPPPSPSPTGSGPQRGPRDARRSPAAPAPPTPQAAASSVLRWGLLIGGLVIIADLGTRAIDQRTANVDVQSSLDAADLIINVVLFAFCGVAVVRETGAVYLAVLAGLLASFLDGLVVAATDSMAPPPGPWSVEDDILRNVLIGTLCTTISALVNWLILRRTRSGPR